MFWWMGLMTAQHPVPGPEDLDRTAAAIERGGLYSIIVILMTVVVYLYVAKERLTSKILTMVEKQTEVLTRQQISSEKVAEALTKQQVMSEKVQQLLGEVQRLLP